MPKYPRSSKSNFWSKLFFLYFSCVSAGKNGVLTLCCQSSVNHLLSLHRIPPADAPSMPAPATPAPPPASLLLMLLPPHWSQPLLPRHYQLSCCCCCLDSAWLLHALASLSCLSATGLPGAAASPHLHLMALAAPPATNLPFVAAPPPAREPNPVAGFSR